MTKGKLEALKTAGTDLSDGSRSSWLYLEMEGGVCGVVVVFVGLSLGWERKQWVPSCGGTKKKKKSFFLTGPRGKKW